MSATRLHEVLRIQIGRTCLAVPLAHVIEVVRLPALAPVPGAARLVRGCLDLRGTLVPVVDAAPDLGEAPQTLDPARFVLIARRDGRTVGLLCDEPIELATVPPSATCEGDDVVARDGWVRGLVRLGERIAPIVDPARIHQGLLA